MPDLKTSSSLIRKENARRGVDALLPPWEEGDHTKLPGPSPMELACCSGTRLKTVSSRGDENLSVRSLYLNLLMSMVVRHESDHNILR
jgi:hypothetical protein